MQNFFYCATADQKLIPFLYSYGIGFRRTKQLYSVDHFDRYRASPHVCELNWLKNIDIVKARKFSRKSLEISYIMRMNPETFTYKKYFSIVLFALDGTPDSFKSSWSINMEKNNEMNCKMCMKKLEKSMHAVSQG